MKSVVAFMVVVGGGRGWGGGGSEGRRYWGNDGHERAREQVLMRDNILFRNEQHTWMLLA